MGYKRIYTPAPAVVSSQSRQKEIEAIIGDLTGSIVKKLDQAQRFYGTIESESPYDFYKAEDCPAMNLCLAPHDNLIAAIATFLHSDDRDNFKEIILPIAREESACPYIAGITGLKVYGPGQTTIKLLNGDFGFNFGDSLDKSKFKQTYSQLASCVSEAMLKGIPADRLVLGSLKGIDTWLGQKLRQDASALPELSRYRTQNQRQVVQEIPIYAPAERRN